MKLEKHWEANMWTCNDPSIVINEKRISDAHGSYNILIANIDEPNNVSSCFYRDNRRNRVFENGVIVKWSENNQCTNQLCHTVDETRRLVVITTSLTTNGIN
ncbi:MAG: hypothetical protein QXT45_08200 [Candidatus Bilamarchaeaceae archaeon]